jgi:hypothetical protein
MEIPINMGVSKKAAWFFAFMDRIKISREDSKGPGKLIFESKMAMIRE